MEAFSAPVLSTDAPNALTQTYVGVSARSALRILVWVRMSMKPQRATALAAEPLRQL